MIKTSNLISLVARLISINLAFIHLVFAAPDLEKAMANPNNWAHARGQYNNQGYSALTQIDTNNIKDLKLAWTFSTGVNRGHEGAPLVIDGVMYVHTAFPNNVYALDLNNEQKILWQYLPKQAPIVQAVLCCDTVNRGLAYGDGKLFLQQNNGVLVALNAKTGAVVWQAQVNDPNTGATNTNAPMVVKDKLLTGSAGGEFGVRGFIAAYYLKDGQLAWKAYSTGPDAEVLIGAKFNKENPQYNALSVYEEVHRFDDWYKRDLISFKPLPYEQININEPELGVRTWLKPQQEKDGWQHGGGSVTGYFAFDPKSNLVYYGTGNPGVWNPDIRPGDNKWSSSVFARDVDTGEAKWAMQTTPHDEWDYDATNEVILLENNLKTYATQVNKNGFIYTWQANNGTLVAAEKVHPFVNWATSVDLKTGVPSKDARFSTHQDYNMKGGCPTTKGAKSLAPAAYSPRTKLLYVPLNQMCMTFEPVETKYIAGQPWIGASVTEFQATLTGNDQQKYSEMLGAFAAYNPVSTKVVWYNHERFAVGSGILATISNLVFYGTLDRWFKAVDAQTGQELWKFQVGSGVIGNVFTYGHKGKQYVGILSGFGGAVGRDVIHQEELMNTNCGICDNGLGAQGGNYQLTKHNALPGAGTLNIFSL